MGTQRWGLGLSDTDKGNLRRAIEMWEVQAMTSEGAVSKLLRWFLQASLQLLRADGWLLVLEPR